MAFDESIAAEWTDRLKDLNVHTKKMFGCCCLYCDGQAVGWIHDSVLSLREVGLAYLPEEIKRPGPEDKVQELVIPFDYVCAEWLPKAVQDTADIRKRRGTPVGSGSNRQRPRETGKAPPAAFVSCRKPVPCEQDPQAAVGIKDWENI